MTRASDTAPIGTTGLAVSRLGVGGTPFGNLFRAIPEETLAATFETAWSHGLRYYDTAPQYGGGLSEQRLGRLLTAKPRNDFVLSTKVGKLLTRAESGKAPDGIFAHGLANEIVYDYSYDGAMRSFEASLDRLGLDQVDIVYIHDVARKFHGDEVWDRYEEASNGAARALLKLRDEGVIKAFGPASREVDVNLKFLQEFDIDCMMLPARFTLLERAAAEELLPLCAERGVSVNMAGPYDSGILATGPVAGATYNYLPASDAILREVTRIQSICRDAGVDLAAAAIQFPLRHPAVSSVVVGASSPDEMVANIGYLQQTISNAVWDAIG